MLPAKVGRYKILALLGQGKMSQVYIEPQIENPKSLILPSQAEAILKIMFNTYQRVVITAEFGGGFSGSRVYLVRPIRDDSQPELQVVIKLAPVELIKQEWQAYHDCIRRQWPSIAEIKGEPVLPPDSTWGGLRYPMMGGGGTFEIESLYHYFQHTSVDDLRYVLENRLFQITQKTWQFSQPTPEFSMAHSYDHLLPVNLIIKPSTFPLDTPPHLLTPETITQLSVTQGDSIIVEGFTVTEIDQENREVTLNVPGSKNGLSTSYRLRLRPVETMEQFKINEMIVATQGIVSATRSQLLLAEAQQAFGSNYDLAGETINIRSGPTLPNPLLALPRLLSESRDVKVSCIHGDLNLENILVDPATRGVRLIDFADARHDHVLHDLLRLEAGVVTRLLPQALSQARLPPKTIRMIYRQLYREVASTSTTYGILPAYPHPVLNYPTLRKHFAMLVAIRKMARHQLFKPKDWSEYYQGLTIYLLGTLKFNNLDRHDKQVALLGAATLVELMNRSVYLPAIGTAVRPSTKRLAKARLWGQALFFTICIIIAIGLAIWFMPSNSTILSLTNFGSINDKSTVATLVSVNHQVEIKRTDSNRLVSASFGMPLAEGDVVNTYDNATATIICTNGNLFSLPEQNNLTVNCQDTSDERFMGQLDPALSGQILNPAEVPPDVFKMNHPPTSRLTQTQTPLLISPRNTVVADTRPAFHWQPVAGASGYRLSVNLASGEAWNRDTKNTSLPYPADVPPLTPGSLNIVTLSTLDDETAIDKTELRVLDETGLTDVARAEAKIRALELDEIAQSYLLAQLYQQREMWAAAISQLEQVLSQSSIVQEEGAANLSQQLGDLKTRVALYVQAEKNYKTVLALAEAKNSINPNIEAIAHIGLAHIALTLTEADEALDHFTIAEKLYRQAGQTEQANRVALERDSLNYK